MSIMAEIIFSSHCRQVSFLFLSFEISIISFSLIRIVGTHNSVNTVFHLVSIEVYYKENSFALIRDIHGKINDMINQSIDDFCSSNGKYHGYRK